MNGFKMIIFAALALLAAIFGCSTDSNPVSKSDFMVPFVVRAPRSACDYVFVSGSTGQIGTVATGDRDTLYGAHEGEKITAKWRRECKNNTTVIADTTLVRNMVWVLK